MSNPETREFERGAHVVYGIHGRCSVEDVITREIDGQNIRFYKLQVTKAASSRSSKQEPAIWLPVEAAQTKGLRPVLRTEEVEEIFELFTNDEFFYDPNKKWSELLPALESAIKNEGAKGLAKVDAFLLVLKSRQVVPDPQVVRFFEKVHRILTREIAELTENSIKAIDEKLQKLIQQKLQANQ